MLYGNILVENCVMSGCLRRLNKRVVSSFLFYNGDDLGFFPILYCSPNATTAIGDSGTRLNTIMRFLRFSLPCVPAFKKNLNASEPFGAYTQSRGKRKLIVKNFTEV